MRLVRPRVPGADLPHVVIADRTLPEQIPDAKRVVFLTAERAALVPAERLAEQGSDVTMITDGRVAGDVIPTFKWRHTAWVEELGIRIITGARVERIDADAVHYVKDDAAFRVLADRVVVAGPRHPVNDPTTAIEFSTDELYTVGDAVVPRSPANAVHEGSRIGNTI